MLSGMQKKQKASDPKLRGPAARWFLYILRCADGTFYTGITNNLARRFQMHNTGKGARYTRTRGPVELLYQEKLKGRTAALVRECAVKALPRKSKEALINSMALRGCKKGAIL